MATAAPLQLDDDLVHKPIPFINPTKAYFHHIDTSTTPLESDAEAAEEHKHDESKNYQPVSSIDYKWTSRNNRKGRHAIVVQPTDAATAEYEVPPFSNSLGEICKNVWRMLVCYPVWDISWLVAYTFTIGSLIWVINGFCVLLPNADSPIVAYGGGITGFIGATVFEIGSVLLLLEAINTDRSGCFGWALERLVRGDGQKDIFRAVPSKSACVHHHASKHGLVKKPLSMLDKSNMPDRRGSMSWTWWPSEGQLRGQLYKDLGFWASVIQFFAATIFWIAGFTGLPGILNNLSTSVENGVYWVPQVVASVGFVMSGAMFMLETQKHFWLPEPMILGWHIGFWNCIGGFGFLFCGCFGLVGTDYYALQASIATFWGEFIIILS